MFKHVSWAGISIEKLPANNRFWKPAYKILTPFGNFYVYRKLRLESQDSNLEELVMNQGFDIQKIKYLNNGDVYLPNWASDMLVGVISKEIYNKNDLLLKRVIKNRLRTQKRVYAVLREEDKIYLVEYKKSRNGNLIENKQLLYEIIFEKTVVRSEKGGNLDLTRILRNLREGEIFDINRRRVLDLKEAYSEMVKTGINVVGFVRVDTGLYLVFLYRNNGWMKVRDIYSLDGTLPGLQKYIIENKSYWKNKWN